MGSQHKIVIPSAHGCIELWEGRPCCRRPGGHQSAARVAVEVLERPLSTCHLPCGPLRLTQGRRLFIHSGAWTEGKRGIYCTPSPYSFLQTHNLDQNSLKSHTGSLLCLSATSSAGKELAETYVIGQSRWVSGGIRNLPYTSGSQQGALLQPHSPGYWAIPGDIWGCHSWREVLHISPTIMT